MRKIFKITLMEILGFPLVLITLTKSTHMLLKIYPYRSKKNKINLYLKQARKELSHLLKYFL